MGFEEGKNIDDTANEIPKADFVEGLKRAKRQYGDAEQFEGGRDPKNDEIHSIWKGVWGAMIDGAEKLIGMLKGKAGDGQNPGQQ